MGNPVFTIGHSTNSFERFVALLEQHKIAVVCDVRSKPYSRMNPQFNREQLKASLAYYDIKYLFLGKELGARPDDKSCYSDGKVQYDVLAGTELFKSGIERVATGASKYRVALMCAEKEPLECHRTILVSRELHERGLAIMHILGDGKLEEHDASMKRLVSMLRIPPSDMFRPHEHVVRDAYRRQGEQIAYEEQSNNPSQYISSSSKGFK